jgi:hypothetical protein
VTHWFGRDAMAPDALTFLAYLDEFTSLCEIVVLSTTVNRALTYRHNFTRYLYKLKYQNNN